MVEALSEKKIDMVSRGGVYNSSFSTRLLLEPLRFHHLVHSRGLLFPNRNTYVFSTSGKQFFSQHKLLVLTRRLINRIACKEYEYVTLFTFSTCRISPNTSSRRSWPSANPVGFLYTVVVSGSFEATTTEDRFDTFLALRRLTKDAYYSEA